MYYYFEFPTRHPYKICWFEFWVRRPKRLLVAATAARFRGGGGRGGGFRWRNGGGDRDGCRTDDDDPFIVLTETKFSFRCIPVWIGTLLTGLGSKKNTCDNVLTMTSQVPW